MKKILIIGSFMALGIGHAMAASPAPESLRFCTGAENGFYERISSSIGNQFARTTGIKVEQVNTGGSYEVAQKLKDGDCSIGILQSDAVVSLPLPNDIDVTDAHQEAVYWLHPKDGLTTFDKMGDSDNSKKYAIALVQGGGSQVTMAKFASTDKDYAGIRIVEFDDWMTAGKAIAQGFTTKNGEKILVAGGLYVGRIGGMTSDITKLYSGQIQIGQIKDSDFLKAKDQNGAPLYTECQIEKEKANGLSLSSWGAADTYCLRAQIVYNKAITEGLDRATTSKINRAMTESIASGVASYK